VSTFADVHKSVVAVGPQVVICIHLAALVEVARIPISLSIVVNSLELLLGTSGYIVSYSGPTCEWHNNKFECSLSYTFANRANFLSLGLDLLHRDFDDACKTIFHFSHIPVNTLLDAPDNSDWTIEIKMG